MLKSTLLLSLSTFFGLLCPEILVAQNNNETVGSPEYDRIENLIILSEDYWYINTDSSIFFANQVLAKGLPQNYFFKSCFSSILLNGHSPFRLPA